MVGVLLIAAILGIPARHIVQTVFTYVVSVAGLLFAGFYILTALATIAYYRRRVFSNLWDALLFGILPARRGRVPGLDHRQVDAASPRQQNWSLIGILAPGPDHDVLRAVRPAVAVLPDPAGERSQERRLETPNRMMWEYR